jgi:hypothetical protein
MRTVLESTEIRLDWPPLSVDFGQAAHQVVGSRARKRYLEDIGPYAGVEQVLALAVSNVHGAAKAELRVKRLKRFDDTRKRIVIRPRYNGICNPTLLSWSYVRFVAVRLFFGIALKRVHQFALLRRLFG